MSIIRGGCLCGAIRYEASGAHDVSHCHCIDCRRSSGAAFVTWAFFPRSSFRFTRGAPRQVEWAGRLRSFCPSCGTPLTFLPHAGAELIDVTVCSFDDPEKIVPQDHTWVEDRLPWVRLADGLPAFPLENPDYILDQALTSQPTRREHPGSGEPMEHLSIDRAQPADRDAVVSLLAAQVSEHRMRTEKEKLSRLVDQILADQHCGFLLIAKVYREIVAVAYVATIFSVEHSARVGWLEELYVMPERRDAGVGSALLKSVIQTAKKTGLAALDLEVDVEHQRAESLYPRFGFRRLPRSRWVKDGLAVEDLET